MMLLVLSSSEAFSSALDDKDSAKGYFVRGIVRDSVSDEPVSNVFVSLKGKSRGTSTDDKGIFELTVPDGQSTLVFHSQGYENKTLKINRNRVNMYAVYLVPSVEELGEVVVRRTRYSKKNNPAVDLMRHIRRTADLNDPTSRPYYSFRTYQRMTFGLNHLDITGRNKSLFNRFPFLTEHIDTSEISGQTILPLSLREQFSTVYHRSAPKSKREIIEGKKAEGIDEILDEESMTRFMNDVMGPVDVYSSDINLLQNRFVSPLSTISADFYKFYITDSLTDLSGRKFYTLSFYPHSREAFGFVGQMLVTANDSSAFVKSISMHVPDEINLNFIEKLLLTQEYAEGPGGERLKTRDEMTMEVCLVPGTQGLYARRILNLTDHSFDAPENETEIFLPRGAISEMKDATRRDSIYWNDVRPTDLPQTELKINQLMKRLRSNKIFYWGEKVVRVLVTGYIPTNKDINQSKFDFGPMNTTISGNPLEGVRLRAGGMTTATLSPRLFSRFYGAYGFKDHRWKYGLELEYSFNDKKRHSREFPIHSLRLNSSYDTYRPGQNYVFTNPDNVFLSLHRPGTDPIIYKRDNSLTYTLETETNFSIKASVGNERLTPSPLMGFDLADGSSINGFDETWGQIVLRYAPGEKFYQTPSNRFPINLDAPTFELSHLCVPRAFGSRAAVNVTSLSFMKRFWFSAFGYLDAIVKGAHVWSHATPFNYLPVANTNMSYTIQPESFALTAPMEFVADSYCAWFVTYWANGNILNRIPLIKKLKLREAFSIRGFYGKLSDRNNPTVNTEMIVWPGWETASERLTSPYLEAAVGIDNILRCLRVDYVWRLNHRTNPVSGASRHGIRIAFHVTF